MTFFGSAAVLTDVHVSSIQLLYLSHEINIHVMMPVKLIMIIYITCNHTGSTVCPGLDKAVRESMWVSVYTV